MKKSITVIITSAILSLLAVIGCAASPLSPALDVITNDYKMTVTGIIGEDVVFDKKVFCDAAGNNDIESICITALPKEAEGTLMYNDSAIAENQIISADNLPSLRFVAKEGVNASSFKFTFDGLYTMCCNIKFSDKINNAPEVFAKTTVNAMSSTVCGGTMRAVDPDGDDVLFEIVSYPEHGNLTFDRKTGEFSYKTKATGSDSFVYRACDVNGAYSANAEIELNVTDYDTVLTFADMDGNINETAAVTLTDAGIMSAKTKNGKKVFSPDTEMTRLDFLVSAMDVFGAANLPDVKDCGFADNEEIPKDMRSYVYSAYKLGIINGIKEGDKLCFKPNAPVTKAQASVILNNIIGYKSKTKLLGNEKIPDWALDSVSAMYEIGAYPLSGGEIRVSDNLTKGDAASMLYAISCMLYE